MFSIVSGLPFASEQQCSHGEKSRAGGGTPKHITEVLFPLYIFVQEIQALGKEEVYITAIKREKEKEIYIIATK